jgi:hypothetical protein
MTGRLLPSHLKILRALNAVVTDCRKLKLRWPLMVQILYAYRSNCWDTRTLRQHGGNILRLIYLLKRGKYTNGIGRVCTFCNLHVTFLGPLIKVHNCGQDV